MQRAQMLVLAARGLSNRQIALELGANEHVVGRGAQGIQAAGISCLRGSSSSGATAQQSG